jgi:5-methylcytosine-specific restriction endonuclease McrA
MLDRQKQAYLNSLPELHQSQLKRIASRTAYAQKSRSASFGCLSHFTGPEWQSLCQKFHYACLRCGDYQLMTPDHVTPLHLGGSNQIDNIQPLCRSCNSFKKIDTTDYRSLPASPIFYPQNVKNNPLAFLRNRMGLNDVGMGTLIGLTGKEIERLVFEMQWPVQEFAREKIHLIGAYLGLEVGDPSTSYGANSGR